MQDESDVFEELGLLAELVYSDQYFQDVNRDIVIGDSGNETLVANTYAVVKTSENSISGFQGMLVKSPDDKYVFTFRGTEPPDWYNLATYLETFKDLVVADFMYMGIGNAPQQMKDAMAFVQEMKVAYALDASNTKFTGHSLGGAIAGMASYVFGFDAYTYNGFGINNMLWDANDTSTVDHPNEMTTIGQGVVDDTYQTLGEYMEVLGVEVKKETGRTTNIIQLGDSDNELVGGIFTDIVSGQMGETLFVLNQDSGDASSLLDNHDKNGLNESIAVYNNLLTLFPGENYNSLTDVLFSSSPKARRVERFVEALSELTGAAVDQTNLVAWSENIEDSGSWSFALNSFAEPFPANLVDLAQNNHEYLYALIRLNPYTITSAGTSTGVDYSFLDDKVFSAQYLEDRTDFLFHAVYPFASPTTGDDTLYQDFALLDNEQNPLEVYTGDGAPDLSDMHYVFGTDGIDEFKGDSKEDHLYGMEGNDVLRGEGGNDYLEGGTGMDTMYGGDGDDTFAVVGTDEAYDNFIGGADYDKIIGGAGDDTIRVYNFDALNSIQEIDGGEGEDVIAGTGDSNTIDLSETLVKGVERIEGGGGQDEITGTSGDDVLYGGSKDVMEDNAADILKGGAGNDTYYVGSGDTISDLDNSGTIFFKGQNVADMNFEFLYEDARGEHYKETSIGGWVTYDAVNNNLKGFQSFFSIDGFTNNDFGISLERSMPDPIIEPTPNGITVDGDLTPQVDVDADGNVSYNYDTWGNLITTDVAAPGRADSLYDTPENDVLRGHAGDDTLYAGRGGDDVLDGGSGYDVLSGGSGNDVLLGGSESDALFGGDNDDRLFADEIQDLATVYQVGETEVGTGVRGDLLSGNAGNDQLYGAAGNDGLAGGSGNDIIYGGAGDDVIEGDGDLHGISNDWSVIRALTAAGYERDYDGVSWSMPLEQGDDVIYGGAGSDWIYAAGGDDFVDGGADDDVIFGEGGHDMLLGQSGNDHLQGDDMNVPIAEHGNDYLDGGDGNDGLWGMGGNDTLFGGLGDDELVGDGTGIPGETHGNDYLDGGEGNDKLWGQSGADVLVGGLGDDMLIGDAQDTPLETHGDDFLDGGDGNDSLAGGGGSDTLIGGVGNDYLVGDFYGLPTLGQGDDVLDGGEGSDRLEGGRGNDTLTGGTGNDYLDGGDDNDTYLFSRGFGQDSIYETGGDADAIIFSDISSSEVVFARNELDLVLTVNGSTDRLIVKSWFTGDTSQVEQIEFSDGAVWDTATIMSKVVDAPATDGGDVLSGSEGNDTLSGEAGDDSIDGGAGNDFLMGGSGNDLLIGGDGADIYSFSGGFGQDIIYETLADNSIDTVLFTNGITPSDILVSWNNDNLYLSVKGTTDQVTLAGWANAYTTTWSSSVNGTWLPTVEVNYDTFFAYNSYHAVEQVVFAGDGTVWNVADLIALAEDSPAAATELDDNLTGSIGSDSLYGFAGDDTLLGLEGDDFLDGGIGNDTLVGGAGDDTYLYIPGDGIDTIIDTALPGEGNTLAFGGDITADAVTLGLGSLLINTGNAGDQIHIENFNPNDVYGDHAIENFQFADGTSLSYQQLLEKGFGITGTVENDLINGTNVDDRIIALAGDDIINSGAGKDVIEAGSGDDQINSGDGDDLIHFGLGDGSNIIFDTGGSDALVLDDGLTLADTLVERIDNDLLVTLEDGSTSLVKDWALAENKIENIQFGDGTVQDIDSLFALLAEDYMLTLTENTSISGTIELENAGEDVVYSISQDSSTGVFTINADGTWVFTPDQDFIGSEQILVTVTNAAGEETISTLDFTITPINNLPEAPAEETHILQDLRVLVGHLEATDLDGDILSYSVSTEPGYGTLTIEQNGNWNYQAADLYIGLDSAVITIDDGKGGTITTTLNLDVMVSSPTIDSTDQNLLEDENLAGQFQVTNPIGGNLIYEILVPTAHGEFSIAADGSFSYAPSLNYNGVDTITLMVTNEYGLSTTKTINLTIEAVNDIPVVQDIPPVVLEGVLVANGKVDAFDVDGDVLSYSVKDLPLHGSLSIDDQGNWLYMGEGGYFGTDQATITVDDGNGGIVTTALTFDIVGNVYEQGDWILEADGPNDVQLKGISKDALQLTRTADDLLITVRDRGSITMNDYFVGPENGAEWLDTTEGPLNLAKEQMTEMSDAGKGRLWLSPVEYGEAGTKNLIYGTDTNDRIYGAELDDVFFGADGHDTMKGYYGNDTLIGGAGNDSLSGEWGDDSLYGDSGNDSLLGGFGNDALMGGDGRDILAGDDGHDWLFGNSGNDRLSGNDGDDLLNGGTGNDMLEGGDGNDTYLLNKGDGEDVISEKASWKDLQPENSDTVKLGEGIIIDDVSFVKHGSELVLQYGDNDVVTIRNQFDGRNSIERVELVDGSYLTDADINQLLQDMASYAVNEGITLNANTDVRQNAELMTMVIETWHK